MTDNALCFPAIDQAAMDIVLCKSHACAALMVAYRESENARAQGQRPRLTFGIHCRRNIRADTMHD